MLKLSLIFAVMLFFTCSKTTDNFYADSKNMKTEIMELSKRSGISFSEKAKVVFQEDNLGGSQEAQGWLIYSDKSIELPKDEVGYIEKGDAQEYLENFKKNAPEENFGNLKSGKSISSSWMKEDGVWRKEDGAWSGTIIETDKGFYLKMEWVKQ